MNKKEHLNPKHILEQITPVIEQIVLEQGFIPLEVAFVNEYNKWFVRIFIYNARDPITHNDCEKVTHNLESYLDQLVPVHYYLEVSSPGLDRRIKSSKEYIIFKGKKATVKLKKLPENMSSKTFNVQLIDYNKEKGLKVRHLETNEEILIEEKNIQYVQLLAEYNI